MKNKVILGIIIINIILTYLIILNNYKHYNTNIEDNNINYNYSNLAIYQKKDTEACKTSTDDSCYEEIPSLPSGEEYVINQEKSVCYLKSSDKHYDRLYTNQNGEHVIKNMLKEEKCYVYFDKVEKHEMNVTILAQLGSETINFPTQGSKNPVSVTCDNNATAKFDYTNWQVEVDAFENTDITCTVKFEDFTPQPFNTYLTTNYSTLGLINEHGYRYEGAQVNNYVLFNDELWRIIGVFEAETETNNTQSLVKLIRADALDGLAWNKDNKNTWEGGSLQLSLNNGYLNKEDETCNVYSTSVTKTCNFSEIGLSPGAGEKIEAVKWNIGKSDHKQTTETVYESEITEKTTSYYKVGLMSASDYGYAVKAGSCSRSTSMYSYDNSACAGSNWLKNIGYEWTITTAWFKKSGGLYVDDYGKVYDEGQIYDNIASRGYGARPSVYLKSNINVIGGTGARSLPYIIN